MVREDESAGGQMISKMGRQSVRYAGYVASGGSVEVIGAIFTLTLIPRKLLVGPE